MQDIAVISQGNPAVWSDAVHVNIFINVHHKFSFWVHLKVMNHEKMKKVSNMSV